MTNGPFRDNIEGRVRRLEDDVAALKSRPEKSGPHLGHAVKEHIIHLMKEGYIAFGGFTTVILVIAAVGVPSCVNSCESSPEQIRAEEEVRQAKLSERRQACEDINMHYVGYDSHWERLTCANEERILTIDTDDGESWSVPVEHQRE